MNVLANSPEVLSVRFDDMQSLGGLITRGFGAWGPEVSIDQMLVDCFVRATSNPARPGYAPDYLLPCLLPKLSPANDWEITGHKNALNMGCPEIRFLQRAPTGAVVHCRSRLAAAVPHPRGVRVTLVFEVEDTKNAALCMQLSIELLYQGEAT